MLIVEGPDGSGKNVLIQHLARSFSLPLHERAVDSNGPPENHKLFQWAYDDVTTMADQPLSIYNRHPLVSEYVYAPILRTLHSDFSSSTAHLLLRMVARRSLLILCRPPLAAIMDNVAHERDMDGVVENIENIVYSYDMIRVYWPGELITYDYTDPNSLEKVMAKCRLHLAHEMMNRSKIS